MTKQHVKQPMQFSQAELEQRQKAAQQRLLEGYWKETASGMNGWYVHPCADQSAFNNPDSFLQFVEAQTKQGRERYPHIAAVITPTFFSVAYYKPQDELDAILAASDQQVEQDYRKEMADFNQAQITLLAEQLYAQEQKKKLDAEQKKEQTAKAKAMEEAQQYFASITQEKK